MNLRVGLVCPYSWDVPGGVQFHVRDLAEALIALGHEVSVLTPADDESPLPPYVVAAGRAVPVPYNGSVARLNFGPLTAARARRWLADGGFDVVHVHEPTTPSVSLLACYAASGPIVATFHTANMRSRVMAASFPILNPALEKVSARIAVSEAARRTLVEHLGGDAVLIPNGVYVDRFARAVPSPEWVTDGGGHGAAGADGGDGTGGTLGFIGRIDEPRKGLDVLLDAFERILRVRPQIRLLVAGNGEIDEVRAGLPAHVRASVIFLGQIGEADKARLLRSVDLYVAPNLGGESFGIILVEAMAAGAPVLASDLDAFRRVLDGGRAGALFPAGNAAALAEEAVALLEDCARRERLRSTAAAGVWRYDWSRVAGEILEVYETVIVGAGLSRPGPEAGRWRRNRESS